MFCKLQSVRILISSNKNKTHTTRKKTETYQKTLGIKIKPTKRKQHVVSQNSKYKQVYKEI